MEAKFGTLDDMRSLMDRDAFLLVEREIKKRDEEIERLRGLLRKNGPEPRG